jgi:hypothetical protein
LTSDSSISTPIGTCSEGLISRNLGTFCPTVLGCFLIQGEPTGY